MREIHRGMFAVLIRVIIYMVLVTMVLLLWWLILLAIRGIMTP